MASPELETAVLETVLLHDHACLHAIREHAGVTDLEPVTTLVNRLVRRGVLRAEVGPTGEAVLRPGTSEALHSLTAEATECIRALIDVRLALRDLRQVAHGPHASRVTHPETVGRRLERWREHARTRSVEVLHGPRPPAAKLDSIASRAHRLAARGLDVALVFPSGQLTPDVRTHLEHVRRHGVEVVVARTSHRLAVIDDERVVVISHPAGQALEAVFIDGGRLPHAFARYADKLLACGQRPVAEDPVRRTVELLAAGMTDAAAAKELGVTERHLRRHVATAMEDLGAASRFQAGVLAGQRYHLP